MRYFKAATSGAVHYRASRYDDIDCAIVIHPLEGGGGLFPTAEVIWYTSRQQAERHAKDWQRLEHRVELICAEPCSEQEYVTRLLTSPQQSL